METTNPPRPITSPPPPPAAPPSDAALVTAIQTSPDPHIPFSTLINRYQRATIATCLAILRDRQLAEDAAQDAFVSAYRNLPSLRDPAAFGPWLLTIARHRATRLARSHRRQQPTPLHLATPSPSSPDPAPLPDEALLTALATLPDHERTLVLLRHFDGHTVATIAALTHRPLGTVTKQLSRAHDRLRKTLSAKENHP